MNTQVKTKELEQCCWACYFEFLSKAYSEPCQTPKMECFTKIVNG